MPHEVVPDGVKQRLLVVFKGLSQAEQLGILSHIDSWNQAAHRSHICPRETLYLLMWREVCRIAESRNGDWDSVMKEVEATQDLTPAIEQMYPTRDYPTTGDPAHEVVGKSPQWDEAIHHLSPIKTFNPGHPTE